MRFSTPKKASVLGTLDEPALGYVLEAFINGGISIDSVIIDSKQRTDKDRQIWDERTGGRLPGIPLDKFKQADIHYQFVESHNTAETERFIRNRGVDLLVNAATPRILKSHILDAPTIGILNVHPGILPHFRGCNCVEWAIYRNDPVGNSVHFMESGIDEGPIVTTESYQFSRKDTYVDVRTKVLRNGYTLLAKAIKTVISNGLKPTAMPPQGKGRYYQIMDDDKLSFVKQMLATAKYRHQVLN